MPVGEYYVKVTAQRIRHEHVFTDFVLFSVDTAEKIQELAQPPQ